jgi:hypothetical protein
MKRRAATTPPSSNTTCLKADAFVFDQSPLGTGKDMRWVVESKDAKFKKDFYSAENLRAISER